MTNASLGEPTTFPTLVGAMKMLTVCEAPMNEGRKTPLRATGEQIGDTTKSGAEALVPMLDWPPDLFNKFIAQGEGGSDLFGGRSSFVRNQTSAGHDGTLAIYNSASNHGCLVESRCRELTGIGTAAETRFNAGLRPAAIWQGNGP